MTSYEIFQQRTIKAVQTCHDFLRLTQLNKKHTSNKIK